MNPKLRPPTGTATLVLFLAYQICFTFGVNPVVDLGYNLHQGFESVSSDLWRLISLVRRHCRYVDHHLWPSILQLLKYSLRYRTHRATSLSSPCQFPSKPKLDSNRPRASYLCVRHTSLAHCRWPSRRSTACHVLGSTTICARQLYGITARRNRRLLVPGPTSPQIHFRSWEF